MTEPQALLWPQLLYALAQLTEPKSDNPKVRWIWVEAVDADHLRLSATCGTAILVAKLPATHTLKEGAYVLDPRDHSKKPAAKDCNSPKLVQPQRHGDGIPFNVANIAKGMEIDQGMATAMVSPELTARFFKAAAAVCKRVDLSTHAKAVFLRCPNPEFTGEVRGMLANLYVHQQSQ